MNRRIHPDPDAPGRHDLDSRATFPSVPATLPPGSRSWDRSSGRPGWTGEGVAGLVLMSLAAGLALAQTVVLEGQVPEGGPDHFFLPFQVPPGTVEIEVRHDDLSEANILDWGLYDPAGHRGWGGGNSEPAVVNARAASRSYTPGPIVPGTWQVVVGKAKIAEPPGEYRVEVVLRTQTTLPPQPERTPYVEAAPLSDEARWYAGDLHVHSRESGDAAATLDEIADLARSRGLDFVVITDHNTVSHLDFIVDAQVRHPDVLLIPGTEFTTYAGHANAFGVRAWVDHKIGQPEVTIEAAAQAYADQGALLSVNHPVLDLGNLCIGCAWDHAFPVEHLAGLEIGTGGWEPVGMLFTPDALALWDDLGDQGHRIAAIGGSDDHRAGTDTGPFASPIGNPTTLVWATELSERAILDGIAAGRTVVKLQGPEDPMVELTANGRTLEATATGAAGQVLALVVDGQVADQTTVDADPFTFRWAAPDDPVRVRAEIRIDGAPRTVTSHVWLDEAPPAPKGEPERCGCASEAGGAWGGLVLLLAAVRRRR